MWAIKAKNIKNFWTEPMFEITDEFIVTVGTAIVLSDTVQHAYVHHYGFNHTEYAVGDTKDDLKSYIIGKLFEKIDDIDEEIQEKNILKANIHSTINQIAGA
jgi:hypothetical protein